MGRWARATCVIAVVSSIVIGGLAAYFLFAKEPPAPPERIPHLVEVGPGEFVDLYESPNRQMD